MSYSNNRGGLSGRLASHFALSGVAAMGIAAASASAQVVYSTPNWTIPGNIDGLYINVETQQTGTAGGSVAGWDLNPYGATSLQWFSPATPTAGAMMRYPGLTAGSAGNLIVGVPVSASASFTAFTTAVTFGGTAAGNWVLNADNLFGFQFTGSSGQTHYGWGKMSVGATAATRTITEIAYQSTPGVPILVGDTGSGVPYDPCFPFNQTLAIGSNTLSVNQAGAPDVSLSGCGGTAFGANYYKFVPGLTGTFTFSTCSSGAATRIAIVDGCTAGSSQVACNDNACGSSSTVSASLTGGTTYYLVVGAESFGGSLPASLAVTVDGPTILRYTPNWTIPADATGLYLNVETQVSGTTTASVPGWDLRALGASALQWAMPATTHGMLRYPGVTTGGAGNLPLGMPVNASGSYSTSTTETSVTFGSAAGNWVVNSGNNYFGFRFVAASGQTHYGWGRMTVGPTATTRTITEIAIRTTPGVQIRVGETPSFVPPYTPCAPFNPALAVGTNTVALDATAPDLALSGCGGTAFKANYFRFAATTTGVHTFSTCSSGQATRLAVLDGCLGGSNQLACNDDDCGSSSRVSVALTSGQTYYVAVGAESSSATLPSTIAVTVQSPPVPQCVAAVDADYGDNPISSTVNAGFNQLVFTSAAQATSTTINNAQFFKFTPTATGAFTIKACLAGDTKLAIGTGCPGIGGTMSTIAYNDDAPSCISSGTSNFGSWIDATCNGAGSCYPLTQDLVAGQTYYICVGGFLTGSVIAGNLNISGPEGSPCPADYDGDGAVGGTDLTTLLAAWGTPAGDIDGDSNTSGTDLTTLLAAWGPCAP